MLANASEALARLDAVRLEEMALSCAALVGQHPQGVVDCAKGTLSRQDGVAMAGFAGIIRATKSNLDVLRRLRRGAAQLEYFSQEGGEVAVEKSNGDH